MRKEYIVSTLVENKPGVLHRTSNVFRQRGYNIKSISVGEMEDPSMSRMTFTIEAEESAIGQLNRVMDKQIDVVDVKSLDSAKAVKRELALVKISVADPGMRSDILTISNIFRGRIVDVSVHATTVEVTGTPDKIVAFLELASKFGILEIARTGVAALERGE
ncbi:MAG: acetolactate synthase small subunit [Thaumarchaeota archaeon]|nr:acetolactate synthase small subunit [Nitrososphaerota archaeon]